VALDAASGRRTVVGQFLLAACNDASHGLGTTVPVGSMIACQSSVPGYQGVYELSEALVRLAGNTMIAHLTADELDRAVGGAGVDDEQALFFGWRAMRERTSGWSTWPGLLGSWEI
jgi:hypothetical protein